MPLNMSSYILYNIYVFVIFVSLSIPLIYHTSHLYSSSTWELYTLISSTQAASTMSDVLQTKHSTRTPVYFLGIGGPNFMENTQHPAYSKLAAIGQEITTKVKPKAVVVFSAHWQDGPNTIKINVGEHMDIIYDFYGFPPHYYEYKFPNNGSPEVAEKVIEKLAGNGIKVERVQRGLDHRVWAGFIVGKSRMLWLP
jgi:4,5-DOPA dioxygenase extradiol